MGFICGDQLRLFLIRASFRKNLSTTEEIEHAVTTERATLPGFHDGHDFLSGHAFHAEVGVQLDQDLLVRDLFREVFCRVPPVGPRQHLRE